MNERSRHDGDRRDVDDRLADWVDGRMSDKERERFVAELRVSPQLRADLEQYERTVGVVRAALRAPAPSAGIPSAGIADRVMAAIAADAAAPASPRAARAPRRVWWSMAAAVALLAGAIAIDRWRPAPASSLDTAAVDAPRVGGGDGEKGDRGLRDADDAAATTPPRKVEAEGLVVAPQPDPRSVGSRAADDRTRSGDLSLLEEQAKESVETAKPAAAPQAPSPAAPAQPGAKPAFGGPGDVVPPAAGPTGPATGGPGANTKAGPTPVERGAFDRRDDPVDEPSAARRSLPRDQTVVVMVVEGAAVAHPAASTASTLAKDREEQKGQKGQKDQPASRGAAAPKPGGAAGDGGKAKNAATNGDDFYLGATARLDGAALAARVDAFLTEAAAPGASAAAVAWTTARGELRLSPLVGAQGEELEKKRALDQERAEPLPPEVAPSERKASEQKVGERIAAERSDAAPAVERTWLVEGDDADVQVVVACVTRFTRDHKLALRSEETKLPVERGADKASEKLVQAGARAQQPTGSRLVLRFRLRPR